MSIILVKTIQSIVNYDSTDVHWLCRSYISYQLRENIRKYTCILILFLKIPIVINTERSDNYYGHPLHD